MAFLIGTAVARTVAAALLGAERIVGQGETTAAEHAQLRHTPTRRQRLPTCAVTARLRRKRARRVCHRRAISRLLLHMLPDCNDDTLSVLDDVSVSMDCADRILRVAAVVPQPIPSRPTCRLGKSSTSFVSISQAFTKSSACSTFSKVPASLHAP